MSRTLHVDLTPSRRSKRLMQNGYYLQPPGERVQSSDISSEDDDNSSIYSNASSIYSDRAVHYSESLNSPLFRKRRRRRELVDNSGRFIRQDSPSVRNSTNSSRKDKLLHVDGVVSRSMPSLLISKRESPFHQKSDRTRVSKESKTVTSVQHATHRKSQSTLVKSQTHFQTTTISPLRQSVTAMSKNRSHRDTRSATGDQLKIDAAVEQTALSAEKFSTRGVPAQTISKIHSVQNSENSSKETFETKRANHTRTYSSGSGIKYSSEADIIDDESVVPRLSRMESTSRCLMSKFSSSAWLLHSWLSAGFGYFCGTMYHTMLFIFACDVRLLSQRTSPALAKAVRFILFFLLLLLLLSATYLVATRLFDDHVHTVLLPVQSVLGFFQILFQKIILYVGFSEGRDASFYQSYTERPAETLSPHSSSREEFHAMLLKMDSRFAEQLTDIRNEIFEMRREQIDYNAKQQDLAQAQNRAMQKLSTLKDEMDEVHASRSTAGDSVRDQIEEIRASLHDKSHMAVKFNEFSDRLTAFDERLTTLDDFMMKSVKSLDQRAMNTTCIKKIAEMQFIKTFFDVLEASEDSAEERSRLHLLFVGWLSKQGFAKVQEVDENMRGLAASHSLTVLDLEKKFTTQFERIRHEVKRRVTVVTVRETVAETPHRQGETAYTSSATEADVRKWMRDELALYSADRIGLFDHALESAGGSIVSTRCSRSYTRKTALISVFGMPIYYDTSTPRMLIQAGTLPGECWAFEGSEGYVVIGTASAVRPTSFAVDHIPKELSPHGRRDSAPKDFKVLGLAGEHDYEGVVLGEYRYEGDGPVVQQFAVTAVNEEYFRHFELRIASNWGHPEYTCVYRFRVHGDIQETAPLV